MKVKFQVRLAEGRKEKKSIFDHVVFSMKTTVLEDAARYIGSISHVDNDFET